MIDCTTLMTCSLKNITRPRQGVCHAASYKTNIFFCHQIWKRNHISNVSFITNLSINQCKFKLVEWKILKKLSSIFSLSILSLNSKIQYLIIKYVISPPPLWFLLLLLVLYLANGTSYLPRLFCLIVSFWLMIVFSLFRFRGTEKLAPQPSKSTSDRWVAVPLDWR